MVEESYQNVYLIQKDASSFAEFEIPEFRYRESTVVLFCTTPWSVVVIYWYMCYCWDELLQSFICYVIKLWNWVFWNMNLRNIMTSVHMIWNTVDSRYLEPDISNSAKFEASTWMKNTFCSLSPTIIWRRRLFYKSKLPEVLICTSGNLNL